jgi:hypothetical protein
MRPVYALFDQLCSERIKPPRAAQSDTASPYTRIANLATHVLICAQLSQPTKENRMKAILAGLTFIATSLFATQSIAAEAFVKFNFGIGVDPTAAGGNTVRGIAPAGRPWLIRKLSASVLPDSTLNARGRGLLISNGDLIGTRGTVTALAITLACGPADGTATLFNTIAPIPLDASGQFSVRAPLSTDGVNKAVLPATCANPVLLVRPANATTGVAAASWIAAGIMGGGDDD